MWVSASFTAPSSFRLALVLVEIRLQLLLGFDCIGDQFALHAEGQFADVAVCGAGCASDEADDDEFSLRHRDFMAGE
jgi:hypothetical protein